MGWKSLTAKFAIAATFLPFLSNLGSFMGGDPYQFPDASQLHPINAPEYTQRELNPLWAPTAYLQGIDCLSTEYQVKSLSGEIDSYTEYQFGESNTDKAFLKIAEDTSFSFSVHVNQDGHAIIDLKAMALPFENDKHEKMGDGTYKDVFERDAQISAIDMLAEILINDPDVKTMESVGFAQGSQAVYHLAEKYKILGTIISDTGTDYTSPHLKDYVVSIDVPGDIHSFHLPDFIDYNPPYINTGAHKPATEIDLSDAVTLDWSKALTPIQYSWVEHIQTLAFKMDEANAPEGYQSQGTKLLLGGDKVCNNPTMNLKTQ